jgi:hypothetical protein
MKKVIIDPSTLERLGELREHVEFCDENGCTLGYFHPHCSRDHALYERVKIPATEEQLQRAERELGGRTLAEILADLEKRS